MKNLKYTALLAIAIAFASCDSKRSNATLGGTKDTSAVAGNKSDSTSGPVDTSKLDTTNKGNVNPSGHMSNDSAKNPH